MNTYLCFVRDTVTNSDTCFPIKASCERLARFGVFSILNNGSSHGTIVASRYEIIGVLKL